MDKLKFDKQKIEKLIQTVYPNSRIKKYSQFTTGLVSPTFKVEIENPRKILVLKLARLKINEKIHKNNEILNYLHENKIPAPKIILEKISDKKIITIMTYLEGKSIKDYYRVSNKNTKEKMLRNAAKKLKDIHNLKIKKFWQHQKHEIKNKKEWKSWTSLRIEKYLRFFKNKIDENIYYKIAQNLENFQRILKNKKIDFVPLHWDYHPSNINVDKNGKVTGIFDFDNAMKGHSLGDIGQSLYWIKFETDDKKASKYFLDGYKNFDEDEIKIINGYLLLHMLATTRSIWKKKRLNWIIQKHMKMINEMLK